MKTKVDKIMKELYNEGWVSMTATGVQFFLRADNDGLAIETWERRPSGHWCPLSWHPCKDEQDAKQHILFTLGLFN